MGVVGQQVVSTERVAGFDQGVDTVDHARRTHHIPYLLKWIVHDWDDTHATTILRNCQRAMSNAGTVLLVEGVIPAGNASAEHAQGLWDDVLMMVLFGGRERTAEQYERLLEAAGFRLGEIAPVAPGLCTIEGHPR